MAMDSPPVDVASITAANISRACIQCDGGCGATSPTKRCTRCQTVYYCSVECQKKHWKKEHKRDCVPVSEGIERLQQEDGYFDGKLNHSDEDVVFVKEQLGMDDNSNEAKPKVNMECSICFGSPIVAPVIVKGCCHAFCSSCLYKWHQQTQQNAADKDPAAMMTLGPDGLQSISSKEVPSKCPSCRGEAGPGNVVNAWVAIAQQSLSNAQRKQYKDDDGKKELERVLVELDKVLEQFKEHSGADFALYASKAQILLFLFRPKEALACLEEFDQVNEDKNWKRKSMDSTGMLLLEAKAYIQLADWTKALDRCILQATGVIKPAAFRQVHMYKAMCQFNLKMFSAAIKTTDMIFEFLGLKYRHYPKIRFYKVGALAAMHDIHGALVTMNEAILYETPYEGAFGELEERFTNLYMYKQLVARKI